MSKLLLKRRYQQHQFLICDIMICTVKEVKKSFVPKRKVWRLNEIKTRAEFENEFQRLAQVSSQKTGVEDIWKSIKKDLLASSYTVFGWTKEPPRHSVTWWWNNNVDIAVKEKRRLWKSWKQGGSKEDYLEAKRTTRRAVYDAKRTAELERSGNLLREADSAQVFKIAKQMTTTNLDIVGDISVGNDTGDLATSDHGKHLTWKEEFEENKESLSVNNPIIGPHPQIDKESVR